MKGLSAGVIVTDGIRFVLGHATGQRHWDIPKGGLERRETPAQAAVRELWEETGLVATVAELEEIGRRRYSKRKDLHLFILRVDKLPDPNTLRCSSKYRSRGRTYPEFDRFKLVPFGDVDTYCVPNMARALKLVFASHFDAVHPSEE